MSETVIAILQPTQERTLRESVGVGGKYIGKVSTSMNAVARVVCVQPGDTGQDSLPGDEWYKVVDVKVLDKPGTFTGWMAARHKGEQLCTVTWVEEPEIPAPPSAKDDVVVTVDTKLKTVTIHTDEAMVVYYNGDKLR